MSELKKRIEDGAEGKYEGLNNGFDRLNDYIFGVQRGIITLIGGQSGVFKTTLLDFMVLNAIEDAEQKGITLNVFYNSFEIDKLTKMCNWLSVIIYNKYNIVIPPEVIKGFGKNRLTVDQGKLVDSEIEAVEAMFSKIQFCFKPNNPTGLYNTAWKWMENRGTFIKENYDSDGETKSKIIGFKHKNPDEYNWMVTDHLYLLKKERDFDVKRNIDKFSEYQVELARLFKFTFTNLQQFNQSLSSVDRMKFKGADLSPQQSDFRDSTNPYSDSDICIGLMSPYKMDMETCLGYDIKKLKSSMLMLKIIKNRLSRDNIAIGLHVNPKAGSFRELPKADDMTADMYNKIIQFNNQ
jgi:replicative DNA helicase